MHVIIVPSMCMAIFSVPWTDARPPSSVKALHGDLQDAACQHLLHYFIWQLWDLPPERFELVFGKALVEFYPLRPEFAESTYWLYRATGRHPFYLQVGTRIMDSLNRHARVKSVADKTIATLLTRFSISHPHCTS